MMEAQLLAFSQTLFSQLKKNLFDQLKDRGFVGLTYHEKVGVKDTHSIDYLAYKLIKKAATTQPYNIYMEGFEPLLVKSAKTNLYIDPVDGSRNWDRGVGDPCFCLAAAPADSDATFGSLFYSFIGGYFSGDIYYTQLGKSFFKSSRLQNTYQISSNQQVLKLSEAHAYLKAGYSAAQTSLDYSLPVFLAVKDIRAIENSGIELCEIARGAADLMIEARKISDFYNLLAYPIAKNAGVLLTDLSGNSLDDVIFDPTANYDFIAAANEKILAEVIGLIK